MSSNPDLLLDVPADSRHRTLSVHGESADSPESPVDEYHANAWSLAPTGHRASGTKSVSQSQHLSRVQRAVLGDWSKRVDNAAIDTQEAGLSVHQPASSAKSANNPAPDGNVAGPSANTAIPPAHHNVDPTWVVGGILVLAVASMLV